MQRWAAPRVIARVGAVAAEHGAAFVLDSSGPGLTQTIGRTPLWLVKPSLNEFQALVGRVLEDIDAIAAEAMAFVATGKAEIVAVTLGLDGAVIASACDVRIASADAKIAFLFTKVGLSGADMGATWLLPRLIGLGRANELLMTGDFVSAAEAERIGLYNRVVPKDELPAAAREWAEKLARGPSFGLEVTKKMLYREAAMDVESALAAEVEIQAACMEDPNFRESYEAFKAKRKPEFG